MIKKICIENFKLFEKLQQELKPLTLLTGLNGRGKSSFLQAMLVAWGMFEDGGRAFRLSNRYVRLGSLKDIVPWQNGSYEFGITLNVGDSEWSVCNRHFRLQDGLSDSLGSTYISGYKLDVTQPSDCTLPHLQYLSTYRMGDMQSFPEASEAVEMKSLSVMNGDGRATAHYMERYGKESVSVLALRSPLSESARLDDQVNAWLKIVSPDVDMRVETFGTDYQIRYIPAQSIGNPTVSANASNVGYGITYALPMITAILSSSPGDVVIVETPEAHIHPAGQARLMDLCSLAAANGIQVILETHSDHIVHGVLRNLKKEVLKEDDVAVLFFDKEIDEEQPCIVPQKVTQKGRIRKPSPGFFDQYMNDMDALL